MEISGVPPEADQVSGQMEGSDVRCQVSGKRDIKAETFMRDCAGVTKNSKSQISNNKQITMTEIQNPKPVLVIWILVIRICFGFRYSDFGFKLSPWLVNKSGYRNLVSTVCGAKAIGV